MYNIYVDVSKWLNSSLPTFFMTRHHFFRAKPSKLRVWLPRIVDVFSHQSVDFAQFLWSSFEHSVHVISLSKSSIVHPWRTQSQNNDVAHTMLLRPKKHQLVTISQQKWITRAPDKWITHELDLFPQRSHDKNVKARFEIERQPQTLFWIKHQNPNISKLLWKNVIYCSYTVELLTWWVRLLPTHTRFIATPGHACQCDNIFLAS